MRLLLLFVSGSGLLAACYTPRYVYSPAAHNVPLFTKKADSKLGINYSSNFASKAPYDKPAFKVRSNGMDIQGAYAFSKKFAIQAAWFTRTEKNEGNYSTTFDSAIIRYHRRLGEVGLGYYTLLNRESSLIFQCFAGVGIGRFRFTDNGKDAGQATYNRFHGSRVVKLYVQPAFQYKNKKQAAASLSSRFSIISFNNIETNYTQQEQENFELDRISSSPAVFWEPAFINSFGFKKLPGFFVEYQAGLSLLMSRRFVDARSFNFSVGVFADLPKLLKKKAADSKKGSAFNQ